MFVDIDVQEQKDPCVLDCYSRTGIFWEFCCFSTPSLPCKPFENVQSQKMQRVSVKHGVGVGVGVHCSFVSFSVLCFG